jgi:ADP-dependent NAD(P)H-hydrate dehydratase
LNLNEASVEELVPAVEVLTHLPVLPPRRADSNKGQFGRILVVAGSRGMSGAAILSSSAALRAGAGLVYLATPASIQPLAAAANPCYLTSPLPEDPEGRLAEHAEGEILRLAEGKDVLAVGPGLGRSAGISKMIAAVLGKVQVPLVLDADGLNALEQNAKSLKEHKAPLIMTPHPGEFARLLGTDVASVQSQRRDLAVRFAQENGVVLVLKGQGSIVTDGRRVYVNTTGNPGMASGGTGDVLTGVIAALLGQHLEPFAAAQLGVHVHGLAGDLARDELGEISLIASDLLDYLPRAFRQF